MVYQLAGDEVDRQLLIPAGEDPIFTLLSPVI